MKRVLALAVLAATLVSGPLSLSPAFAAEACLQKGSVHGWDVPDTTHVVVNSNVHDKFTVTLLGRCIGLPFTESLAFETKGGSLCVEPGDSISFRSNGTRQTCVISDIKPKLAEETPR